MCESYIGFFWVGAQHHNFNVERKTKLILGTRKMLVHEKTHCSGSITEIICKFDINKYWQEINNLELYAAYNTYMLKTNFNQY